MEVLFIERKPVSLARQSRSDPWIFRDGRIRAYRSKIRQLLSRTLQNFFQSPEKESNQLSALIMAGELESALADACDSAAPVLTNLTDSLAMFIFGVGDLRTILHCARHAEDVRLPETLTISPPEGFTYYALNPLEFVKTVARELRGNGPVAILGVRSIGTTLGAVTAAELRSTGLSAERISIRPAGHPYNRQMHFNRKELDWITGQKNHSSLFLIVDEGPGMSGSTFLSVAEALVDLGISRDRILLVGTREPDPEQLCTHNGKDRWSNFRFFCAARHAQARFSGYSDIGGGMWRSKFLQGQFPWPATWPQMERAKYLAPDGRNLFKFEGLGHRGKDALERARILAAHGFSCDVEDAGGGFASYCIPSVRPLTGEEISTNFLERVAHYCKFRNREFVVKDCERSQLVEMVQFNLLQEFPDSKMPALDRLHEGPAILNDGKMQPHEWLRTDNGIFLKTDATWHGDDHFFPGPTSVAWDIAGICIEWNLHRDAVQFLSRRIITEPGGDVRSALPMFFLAYAIFRASWCRMARTAVGGTPDETILDRAYKRYRRIAARILQQVADKPRVYMNLEEQADTHDSYAKSEYRSQAKRDTA